MANERSFFEQKAREYIKPTAGLGLMNSFGEASSKVISRSTLVWFIAYAIAEIWHGSSLNSPLLIKLLGFAAAALTGGFLLVNLLCLALIKERRHVHLALCFLFLIALGLSYWMSGMHTDKRRAWFYAEGRSKYETLLNVALTESQTGPESGVHSRARISTNSDGSITVFIPHLGMAVRRGYLHYSGTNFPSSHPNIRGVVHLTNGWYEY